jgi:type II secretory pathway pseudopilin PulG
MGAVVILGIVGVSLITSSMDSSHRARQARDRMAASLLADSTLAAIETRGQLEGLTPGNQHDATDDGFEIDIAIQPADLAELAGDFGLAGGLDRGEGKSGSPDLFATRRNAPAVLTQIHIRVTDPGGSIAERVSFVFDAAASPELQALAPVDDTDSLQ